MTGVPRGKPTSPEALEKVAKNLNVQRSHGAFEWLKTSNPVPTCNQCILASECPYKLKGQKCQVVLDMYDEIFSEVMNLGRFNYTDQLLIDRFVKNHILLFIIEKWVASVGPFRIEDGDLKVQAIMDYKNDVERVVLRYADSLGIGPQARARLQLTSIQTFNFAEALQKAKPIAGITIPKDENDNS